MAMHMEAERPSGFDGAFQKEVQRLYSEADTPIMAMLKKDCAMFDRVFPYATEEQKRAFDRACE